jgi:hypothetical protein
MKRSLIAALAFLPVAAFAQQVKYPSTNVSGTIAVTNTFQSIAGEGPRSGCMIQNKGSNDMWVFFGPIATATRARSVRLAIGLMVTCNNPGATLSDQISISGTATEEFLAIVQ